MKLPPWQDFCFIGNGTYGKPRSAAQLWQAKPAQHEVYFSQVNFNALFKVPCSCAEGFGTRSVESQLRKALALAVPAVLRLQQGEQGHTGHRLPKTCSQTLPWEGWAPAAL